MHDWTNSPNSSVNIGRIIGLNDQPTELDPTKNKKK